MDHKDQNHQFAAILDSLFEGVLVVDASGRIVWANRAMEENLTLGCNATSLGLDELSARQPVLGRLIQAALAEGRRQTYLQEVRNRRLVLSASPVLGPEGRIELVACHCRDITELDRLQRRLERIQADKERYQDELEGLRATWAEREEIIATSEVMRALIEMARRVARVNSTVLLLGESGAGKGQFARLIHRNSDRGGAPLVKVDCASIPEPLIESELFGYETGAFTGARKEGKPGLVEQANRGTLFLDEIAELPLNLQVKLLQLIQDRSFTRVGGIKPVSVDVRIIAATHRDLNQMVQERMFRQDLYYRLHVVPILIPPLRERREDIPTLVHHFLEQFKSRYRVEKQFAPKVMQAFLDYRWPGNVRELENMVERLVVTTEGAVVGIDELPPALAASAVPPARPLASPQLVPLKEAVENLECEMVSRAFQIYRSSTKVAEVLGIHQTTAARKIRQYLRSLSQNA